MKNSNESSKTTPSTSDMSLGVWLHEAESALTNAAVFLGHGTDNYWDEALHLTLPTLGIAFDADRAVLERKLTGEEIATLEDLLKKRIDQRIPVPYLTQTAWFAFMPFYVNSSVLIPRSPIAELIENGFQPWFIKDRFIKDRFIKDRFIKKSHDSLPMTILDLCCGGGCIGIACAQYMPECHVDLADLSGAALEVARENIHRYQLETRVSCYQGDLFGALPVVDNKSKTYDVIVCNPPYVDAMDMATLPPECLHEPRLALEAGADGLDLVRRILASAADYLNDGGLLIVEVGNSWEAVEEQYPDVFFTWLEFERGGHGVFLLYKDQLEEYRPLFDL